MNFDKLTICPRCGGDALYVEEVNQDITTKFCFSCGFQSNSLMVEGHDFYKQQLEILPELYKDLIYTDDEGKKWMPSSTNLPQTGMIFANGNSSDNWMWSAVKAVPVLEDEKTKYPIPGKKGEYYEWRMSMETIQHFPQNKYLDALEYLNLI